MAIKAPDGAKKTKVGFSFPAPKAECMNSGGAQGKMKGIQ